MHCPGWHVEGWYPGATRPFVNHPAWDSPVSPFNVGIVRHEFTTPKGVRPEDIQVEIVPCDGSCDDA